MLSAAPVAIRGPLGVRSAAEHAYTRTCTEPGGGGADATAFAELDACLRGVTSEPQFAEEVHVACACPCTSSMRKRMRMCMWPVA